MQFAGDDLQRPAIEQKCAVCDPELVRGSLLRPDRGGERETTEHQEPQSLADPLHRVSIDGAVPER
ncbi:MAG TPA: hypothetical protein VIC55_09190 [Gemmatimonadaceae bacterium]